MATSILLVEDDQPIREMIRFAFAEPDFIVHEAQDAHGALEQMKHAPDVILMDWMLPGISGIEILKLLRYKSPHNTPPVIMLTARDSEDDKVKGLQSGADDYLTKPFSMRELKARIEAILRRSQKSRHEDNLKFRDLNIDLKAHQAAIDNHPLKLGPTEFKLLQLFVSNIDRAYSRAQLLDMIWGDDGDVLERTVDAHIRRLRKALAEHGYDRYLKTVWSVGYRFSDQD
ncbi:MAG: response regulator [Gammaproteobacteria bacterium]|nr:MAG: response regulator [Gammaproteobacteria bacterium]